MYVEHVSLSFLQLQELATQLIDLWNLMDTSEEERSLFGHVTCNISTSVDEVTVPGALALDLIEQVYIFLYPINFSSVVLKNTIRNLIGPK